jgi:hypothetical protein
MWVAESGSPLPLYEEASMDRGTIVRRLTTVALAAALTACSEPTSAPRLDESEPNLNVIAPSGLLVCPNTTFDFAWSIVGRLGGLLSLDGHQVIFGQQSLLSLAFVTIREPISPYVEIEVRVNGREHYQFGQPVTVVLDYSRCPESSLPPGPLTAWQIDPATNAFIQNMHGVDNRAARTVTFTTDHFSGYAVAQ